ncbi:uncharacterized protein LOC143477022 isoform X2 [Brachyhypopomus gauderio]|uniref:uncharacterized protein LOC143477022 isoform X2 n=1 Tax=Brachyhypopomus gauderio TaxID=698409 RepID=UPI0040427791
MCFCVFLFFVLLLTVGHEGVHVQGPSAPLVVQLGDTVMLPCYTQGPLPLEGLRVEWRKKDSESVVNIFQHGESRPDLQSPSFRGRAHFFPDEVSKGNFSILLKNLEKSDSGVYKCTVSRYKESMETEVEIKNIERLVVTGADRAVVASVGEEVILNCSIDSHLPANRIEQVAWRHMDRDVLVLLFQDNETFPESSHKSYQGRAEFFLTEIPKGNFSLKLKNVKMEDKGGFMCEVHTREQSGHTIVLLQRVGFSVFNILVLVLCIATLLLAVALCVSILIQQRKKASSEIVMRIHASLILCPNVCMCAAFILWSTEGFLIEVITCSTISLIRPLLLIKTHPYLSRFPDRFQKAVKPLAVPVYHFVIAIAVCSGTFDEIRQTGTEFGHIATMMVCLGVVIFIGAVILAGFGFTIPAAMCLEAGNCALLCLVLRQNKEGFDTSFQIPTVLPSVGLGIMMVLVLQEYGFEGKPLRCLPIALLTVMVVVFSMGGTAACVFFIAALRITFKVWIPSLTSAIHLIAWTVLIMVLSRYRLHIQGCCSQCRGKAYLCCTIIAAVLLIIYGALSLHYLSKYMENHKDCGGYTALIALLHLLASTAFLKHPNVLPYLPHMLVYMFGAVGLTLINSVALATELKLKAGKGVRTTKDLRVTVLSCEMVFVSGWLGLELCGVWMRTRNRIKLNVEDQRAGETQEMVDVCDVVPDPPEKTTRQELAAPSQNHTYNFCKII